MKFFARRRARMLVVLCIGSCLAIDSCIDTGRATLVQIGFSSYTLPFNEAIAGFSSILNTLIANSVLSAISGT